MCFAKIHLTDIFFCKNAMGVKRPRSADSAGQLCSCEIHPAVPTAASLGSSLNGEPMVQCRPFCKKMMACAK